MFYIKSHQFSFLSVLLLFVIHNARVWANPLLPEVKKDSCIDLILCTLKSDDNLYEFGRGDSEYVLELDRNGWNIATEQKNRSIIDKYGDYECVTIRNLQERDTGDYTLKITKEDGIRRLRKTFSLTKGILKNLLNARIDEHRRLPVYWRRTETELPEALQLTAGNSAISEDFSLALVVTAQDPAGNGTRSEDFSVAEVGTAQDPASEKSMNATTPTGTAPHRRNNNIRIIIIVSAVLVAIGVTIFATYYSRNPNVIQSRLSSKIPWVDL